MAPVRSSRKGAIVLSLGAAWAASTAFVTPPTATATSRRELLAAAGLAAGVLTSSLQAPEPALAAGAPDMLEMSGLPGARAGLNGVWMIAPGKSINDRAVYKKSGADTYLMFNDCGSFQLSDKASGACDGFAKEEKGKWSVDGNSVPGIKLKPVKKNADGSAAAPEASGPVKLPQIGLTGLESDDELLFGKDRESVNVVDYIKAKKGGANGNILDNYMSFQNDGEEEIASSLESRLASRPLR